MILLAWWMVLWPSALASEEPEVEVKNANATRQLRLYKCVDRLVKRSKGKIVKTRLSGGDMQEPRSKNKIK